MSRRMLFFLILVILVFPVWGRLRAQPSQTVHLTISDRYLAKADSNIVISQFLVDALKNPTPFFSECIEYDKNIVEFIDVTNGEQTPLPGWTITKTVTTPGFVQISAISNGAPLVDSGEILRMIFHVVDTARPFQTNIFLDSAVVLGAGTIAISDTGMLRVIDACTPIVVEGGAPTAMIAQMFPNPASRSIMISYSLPAAARSVDLRVFDASGTLIRTVENGAKPGGWDKLSLNISNIPNGIYFYDLQADNSRLVQPMLVSH